MKDLIDYIQEHAVRGACRCGRCIDAVEHPENQQPTGHTANLVFFEVVAKPGADPEKLKALIGHHVQGAFCAMNPLDGKPHTYMEVGGWLGSQDLALQLMGLGAVLGLWNLATPRTVFGENIDAIHGLEMSMAQQGMLAIKADA